jgi:hypothetical protein
VPGHSPSGSPVGYKLIHFACVLDEAGRCSKLCQDPNLMFIVRQCCNLTSLRTVSLTIAHECCTISHVTLARVMAWIDLSISGQQKIGSFWTLSA